MNGCLAAASVLPALQTFDDVGINCARPCMDREFGILVGNTYIFLHLTAVRTGLLDNFFLDFH